MKKTHPWFYPPSEAEFSKYWESATFMVDTNVLLNLYRFTPDTRTDLLAVLEKLKGRFWLPHQVAYEFAKRRTGVIVGQHVLFEKCSNALKEAVESLRKKYKRSDVFVMNLVLDMLDKKLAETIKELESIKTHHTIGTEGDPIPDHLDDIFLEVGNGYDTEKLKDKLAEAKGRCEKSQPPGFVDARRKKTPEEKQATKNQNHKPADGDGEEEEVVDDPANKYGDVLLWLQAIEYGTAEEKKKGVILICDDRKEDWWQKESGKTMGPRAELRQEMLSVAGQWFYMYSTDQFLRYAKQKLNLQVKDQTIKEVQEVRKRDEKLATVRFSMIDAPNKPVDVALSRLLKEVVVHKLPTDALGQKFKTIMAAYNPSDSQLNKLLGQINAEIKKREESHQPKPDDGPPSPQGELPSW